MHLIGAPWTETNSQFTILQDVFAFKQAFDGHLFVGAKGSQFRASVEYAPYQKTPTLTPKKDARDGTIEKGEG